jgi:hypothetical protein
MRGWVRAGAITAAAFLLGSVAPGTWAEVVPPLGSPVAPIAPGASKLGTLDRAHPVLRFTGGVDNPTPLPLVNPPVPVVCAVTCQAFTITAARPRPFLVSVKDTAGSSNNGWDLYVYDKDGRLAGAANGVGANGQAIRVAPGVAGEYRIFVTFTYAYDQHAAYAGEVRLIGGASWNAGPTSCGVTVGAVTGCFALPTLVADPAADLHVGGLPPVASTPLGFPFPFAVPTPTSCYVDETVQLKATRCLRFTSNVRNVGAGRLDIRLPLLALTPAPASGFVPGQCAAEQVVHSAAVTAVRPAGPCEYHPAHAHFHYKDLVGFSLHHLGAGGAIGAPVGHGLKESFCLADDDYFGFGTAAPNGPRTYVGQPGCNLPGSAGPDGVFVEEGITPGWGDVYTWDTPGQLIDISNAPAGRYVLVERTNPSGNLLVAGPQQRCASTELTLTADAVTATASHPSIPCPPA